MAGIRFLERLRQMQRDPERRVAASVDEVLHSVIEYVSKILNTRKGSTVLDDNFGISDFTSAGLSFTREDIPKMEQEIGEFIERCEPRLKKVKVHFSPDDGSSFYMVFSINAELCYSADDVFPVNLVTRFDNQGKATVTQ